MLKRRGEIAIALLNLTAKQKAAILLVSLPPEVSAQVFREFKPEEVQALSMEISKLPNISPEARAQVIEEFLQGPEMAGFTGGQQASGFSTSQVIERNAPEPSAGTGVPRSKPLDFLKRVDPHQLIYILRKEHPQTVALVLSQLPTNQASAILSELPPQLQTDVARRVAEIGKISPEILSEVEKVLENKLYSIVEGEYPQYSGKEALVEILSQSDRSTEEKIIAGLTQRSPSLASDIKTKLAEFEDLANVDDSSLQQVLRLTDIRDLVLSLKGASIELATRIYECMTSEAARALKDDVEVLGVVPWDEVKAAQQQIRNILRGLVTLGKISFVK